MVPMSSLETLAEISRRIEQKVDQINGSVRSVTERVVVLEQKIAIHKAEMNQIKWLVAIIVIPTIGFIFSKGYDLLALFLFPNDSLPR